jgi:type I restriction enzyme M protein
MLTGEIRSQIDQVWSAFWSGGISNMSVFDLLTASSWTQDLNLR